MKINQKAPPTVFASVLALRRFADSFVGLTVKESKKRLSRGEIKMTTWSGGRQLVATFPNHQIRLLFIGSHVGVASVQVLSK